METIIAHNLSELPAVADKLLEFAGGRKKFALRAEMGTGKTTFVKAFCQNLGVKEATSSPTYALINEYSYSGGIIRHADLYRLKSADEAIDFGIEDYLYDDEYLFVEWPDIIADILPYDTVRINISVDEQGYRHFSFQ